MMFLFINILLEYCYFLIINSIGLILISYFNVRIQSGLEIIRQSCQNFSIWIYWDERDKEKSVMEWIIIKLGNSWDI